MAYPVLFGADWLTRLRHAAGLFEVPRWQDVPTAAIAGPEWYAGYCRMTDALLDPHRDLLGKRSEVVEYLSALMHHLAGQPVRPQPLAPATLRELAAYLDEHAAEEVSLGALCQRSGYSPGHLIRAFKQHHAPCLPDQSPHSTGPAGAS